LAGQVKLMKHMMGNFLDRAHLCVYQDIGLFVSPFPVSQQFANLCHGISALQQRALTLVMHPIPYRLRRSPKTNDERMRLQAAQMGFVRPQTATRGDYSVLKPAQFFNDLSFDVSECRFTCLGENLGDRPARACFNEFVRIDKLEMELAGHETPNRRLPGAHEAYQREILNVPITGHDS
jgi:hypothetical protein